MQKIGRLCDLLRKAFGRHRIFQQYRAELSTTYMGRNEHFLDYIDRVNGFHRILSDGEYQVPPELIKTKLAEINEFALTSFCDGLPIDYRITPNVCKDLADAFDKALDYYTRLELDKFRYRENRPTQNFRSQPTTTSRYRAEARTRNERSTDPAPRTCAYCSIFGHVKEECFKFKRDQQNRREESFYRDYPPPPPPRLSAPSHRSYSPKKECRYCNNIGHTMEECRKNMWQDKKSGKLEYPPEEDATP